MIKDGIANIIIEIETIIPREISRMSNKMGFGSSIKSIESKIAQVVMSVSIKDLSVKTGNFNLLGNKINVYKKETR